jgi:Flp pilus assembly protein TadG
MRILILLLLSSAAQAADFGPAPYTTNDPAVTVTAVNPNTTTGALAITVNGVNYVGTVTYVYDYNIGSVSYYHSLPVQMTNGNTITVAVNATHWTTRQSSGRGGGYITQHYGVVGGSVLLP